MGMGILQPSGSEKSDGVLGVPGCRMFLGNFQEVVCSLGLVEVLTDLKSPVEIFERGNCSS